MKQFDITQGSPEWLAARIGQMEPTDADLDAGQDADQDATELVDELALQPMPPK